MKVTTAWVGNKRYVEPGYEVLLGEVLIIRSVRATKNDVLFCAILCLLNFRGLADQQTWKNNERNNKTTTSKK